MIKRFLKQLPTVKLIEQLLESEIDSLPWNFVLLREIKEIWLKKYIFATSSKGARVVYKWCTNGRTNDA